VFEVRDGSEFPATEKFAHEISEDVMYEGRSQSMYWILKGNRLHGMCSDNREILMHISTLQLQGLCS
jgi:hypothetical protein